MPLLELVFNMVTWVACDLLAHWLGGGLRGA